MIEAPSPEKSAMSATAEITQDLVADGFTSEQVLTTAKAEAAAESEVRR
jgi:hypothetical protein